ncbi:MAG: ATP phosphoribosyltransferase regulatory subunit [Oscillospiraceae bacterium]|nr:ATP phosphoribosyltransferase regulatory subunit [Oscillospiraceae bacterium]MDD4367664.1 ATP phosphoribosyltransferase regulatory subunit [Oscillospiraceae bacterium]
MKTPWSIYTPDGMTDALPDSCYAGRVLEDKLRQLFQAHAFREIASPGLEFADVYSCGDFARPESLFKLTDAQGRLLALRYDGTVPAARMAATVLRDQPLPLRLFYIEPMYRFGDQGGGRPKAFTQAGVELLGQRSPWLDAEAIMLAVEACRTLGLNQLQISIGQVDFFRGLTAGWPLDPEMRRKLPQYIDQKNDMAVTALLKDLSLQPDERRIIDHLLNGSGEWSLLEELFELTTQPIARAALEDLKKIRSCLAKWQLLDFCSLDLSLLQDLDYYTGIVYKGFTYGVGTPVLSGGRYDRVVSAFGVDRPATGFSLGMEILMQALQRQNLPRPQLPTPAVLVIPYEQLSLVPDFYKAQRTKSAGTPSFACCFLSEGQQPDSLRLEQLAQNYPGQDLYLLTADGQARFWRLGQQPLPGLAQGSTGKGDDLHA